MSNNAAKKIQWQALVLQSRHLVTLLFHTFGTAFLKSVKLSITGKGLMQDQGTPLLALLVEN